MGEYADEQIEKDQAEFSQVVIKELEQDERARRRAAAPLHLLRKGVEFQSCNGGAHLVVQADNGLTVDYWPGPNKWSVRPKGAHRVGTAFVKGTTLKDLVKYCTAERRAKGK